jgi:hypothetical protein
MESKLHENLYFAGEIVNIDAITGGFNRMLGRVGLFWLIVFSESSSQFGIQSPFMEIMLK